MHRGVWWPKRVTKELDMTKQLNTVATGGSHGFVLCKMASVALLGEE